MPKPERHQAAVTRRGFIQSARYMAPLIVSARALGRGGTAANDRINIGVIGTGGRGVFESKHYVDLDGCEVIALCDVQQARVLAAKDKLEGLYAQSSRGVRSRNIGTYRDFRELLARPDIDAVYIATPDHWHVPITIAAMRAGKACHTEKPLGISIEQDLAAVRAVKKYRRPFLYGAERRSTPDARHGLELVLNGRIGDVRKIYAVAPPSKNGGLAGPVLPVPDGFDFNLWLGPAPQAPFCADRVGEGIFHIRDYCLGFIANWGAHALDLIEWWASHAGVSVPETYSGTGKIADGGLYNCATAWDVKCAYKTGPTLYLMDNVTYASRADVPKPEMNRGTGVHNGAIFVGTQGYVAISYEKVVTDPPGLLLSDIGPNERHLPKSPADETLVKAQGIWEYPPAAHQRGWIESLRSDRPSVDAIDSAYNSDLISQLADICVRTGREIRWDAAQHAIKGDAGARAMMSRPMRDPWRQLVRSV